MSALRSLLARTGLRLEMPRTAVLPLAKRKPGRMCKLKQARRDRKVRQTPFDLHSLEPPVIVLNRWCYKPFVAGESPLSMMGQQPCGTVLP